MSDICRHLAVESSLLDIVVLSVGNLIIYLAVLLLRGGDMLWLGVGEWLRGYQGDTDRHHRTLPV